MILGAGALSDRMIRSLTTDGCIRNAKEKNVNPASIDLSINKEAYRITSSASPVRGQAVRELMEILNATPMHPGDIFEPGTMYLVRTNEMFALPDDIYGYCNPKSSVGRDGLLVRMVCDGVDGFDSVPTGKDELTKKPRNPWLLISPTAMPVRMYPGETLAQVRFFTSDTRLDRQEIRRLYRKQPLFFDGKGASIPWDDAICSSDGSLTVSLDLRPREVIGWRCRENRRVIDYSATQRVEDYFDRVIPDRDGGILLKKGRFYILGTEQCVLVPPEFACEVKAVTKRFAHADIHAAGFIDPGWGYGKDGKGRGRRITLEVWPHEDWYIQSGQLIGEISYERMIELPLVHYDEKETSHYRHQKGALPSKRFA